MANIAELRILFRAVDLASREMSNIEAGMARLTAAQKKQLADVAAATSTANKAVTTATREVTAAQKEYANASVASVAASVKAATAKKALVDTYNSEAAAMVKITRQGPNSVVAAKKAELEVEQALLNTKMAGAKQATQVLRRADASPAGADMRFSGALKTAREAEAAIAAEQQVLSTNMAKVDAQLAAEATKTTNIIERQAAKSSAAFQAAATVASNASTQEELALERQAAAYQMVGTKRTALTNAENAAAAATAEEAAITNKIGLLNKLSSVAGTVVGAVGRIGTVGALTFGGLLATVSAVGIGFDAFKQKTEVAFGGLFKSKELGKQFTEELFAFTRKTSLGFEEVVRAATEFKARGFSLAEIIPTLQAVGDQAAALPRGLDESIKIISFNLGQIHQSAVLNQRDVRDLANAGVNSFEYLAEALHTSVGKLKQDLDKHKIQIGGTFAFNAIVEGMKRDFGGMMAIQATTFVGMVSIAKRTFGELSGIFAQPLFNKLNTSLVDVNTNLARADFAAKVKEWGLVFSGFVTSFATGINSTVIPGLQWIISHKAALIGVFTALLVAVAATHPIWALFAVGGVLVTGIGLVKTKSEDLPPALLKVKIALLEVEVAVQNLYRNIKNLVNTSWNAVVNLKLEGVVSLSDLWDLLTKLTSKVWDVAVNINLGGGRNLGDVLGNLGQIGAKYGPYAALPFAGPLGLLGASGLAAKQAGAFGSPVVPWDQMTQAQRDLSNAKARLEDKSKYPDEPDTGYDEYATQVAVQGIHNLEKAAKAAGAGANGAADAADNAGDKIKTLGEKIRGAQSAISSAIQSLFSVPSREQAKLSLELHEATIKTNSYEDALKSQTRALDKASDSIAENQHRLSLQSDALKDASTALNDTKTVLDDRAYALEFKSKAASDELRKAEDDYSRNLNLKKMTAKERSEFLAEEAAHKAALAPYQAKVTEVDNAKAALDSMNHSIQLKEREISVSERAIELQNRYLSEQEYGIGVRRKQSQEIVDTQQRIVDGINDNIRDLDLRHKIQQDVLTLARNDLPTEQDFLDAQKALLENIGTVTADIVKRAGDSSITLITVMDGITQALESFVDKVSKSGGKFIGSPSDIPGRAFGGPISAGQMYRVHQDETIIAGANGYVYPRGASGFGTTNNRRILNLAPITINVDNAGNSSGKDPLEYLFQRM